MSETKNPLTDEVKALIGVSAEKVEASPPWGIEREGLRIFTNAIMDPDPRYWDDEFAKTTKFGGIVTPPIYCSYIGRKTLAGVEDPITRAFTREPELRRHRRGARGRRGPQGRAAADPDAAEAHPERRQRDRGAAYPKLGDHIYSQAKYSEIKGRVTKDGTAMLVVTTQTTYTNQNGDVLCVLRASTIRR